MIDKRALTGLLAFLALGLSACGGGSESSPVSGSSSRPTTTTSSEAATGGDSSIETPTSSEEEAVSSSEEIETPVSSSDVTPTPDSSSSSEEGTASSEIETPDSSESIAEPEPEPTPTVIEHYTRTFEILGPDGTTLPSYASLRLIAGPDFADSLGDENLMTAVEPEKGRYSFDFGTVEVGTEIEYKIVATTSASTSVWTYEGVYSGTDLKENGTNKNPYITVETADDPVVGGWTFASWPVDPSLPRYDFTLSLTLDDFDAETHGGIYLFTSKSWNEPILMEQVESTFTATVKDLLPETLEYYFRTVNEVGGSYIYLQPGIGVNFTAEIVDEDLSIDYVGSLANPNGLLVNDPNPTIEHYVREFHIPGKPDYVTIRLSGSNNGWSDAMDDTTALVPVDGKADTYSYDFGTVAKQSTLTFKLVATTENSTDFWANQLTPQDVTLSVGDGSDLSTLEFTYDAWPSDPAAAAFIEHYTRTWTIAGVPEGVELRIVGSFNGWDAAIEGDANLLTKTGDDTYSFDFGKQEIGAVIQYKIAAVNEASLNFYDFQLNYSGDLWDGQNPWLKVETETDPTIEGFTYSRTPAKLHVEVTITDLVLAADEDLMIKGSFLSSDWTAYSLALVEGTTYEADVAIKVDAFSFGFMVADKATGVEKKWINDGTANFDVTPDGIITTLVYEGTTAGVSLVA